MSLRIDLERRLAAPPTVKLLRTKPNGSFVSIILDEAEIEETERLLAHARRLIGEAREAESYTVTQLSRPAVGTAVGVRQSATPTGRSDTGKTEQSAA